MDRPKQFAENQYVGDKRSQVVYDVDALTGADEALLTEAPRRRNVHLLRA